MFLRRLCDQRMHVQGLQMSLLAKLSGMASCRRGCKFPARSRCWWWTSRTWGGACTTTSPSTPYTSPCSLEVPVRLSKQERTRCVVSVPYFFMHTHLPPALPRSDHEANCFLCCRQSCSTTSKCGRAAARQRTSLSPRPLSSPCLSGMAWLPTMLQRFCLPMPYLIKQLLAEGAPS